MNHLGSDFKTFYNQQGSRTLDKFMVYKSNILNWRIQRGLEIGTLSRNPIKIKTAAKDKYNLADCQIFHIHTSKWENVEFNGKRTQVISETTRKLIQHLTEAKNRAVS